MESMKTEGNGEEAVAENPIDEGGGEAAPPKKAPLLGPKRLIPIVLVTLVLLWIVWTILGFLDDRAAKKTAEHGAKPATAEHGAKAPAAEPAHGDGQDGAPLAVKTPSHLPPATGQAPSHDAAKPTPGAPSHAAPKAGETQGHGVTVPTHAPVMDAGNGSAFVAACIKPLDYELNDRFWGWRPNDIINVTDNVNNFQLGVLEVTRRTSVALAESLSRTRSTEAYVPSLEAAMNCFMIHPKQYWFPTAESKYQEGIDDIRLYIKLLNNGEARFYKRIDNLVPLFRAFESMLGSCDENLVKNQGDLSTFKADNYFYYSRGVASAMRTILEAVAADFNEMMVSIQGADVLHHAITSLEHAAHMEPWIVFEGNPDGFIANHRSNMAAHISHARFYLAVLNQVMTGSIPPG